MVKVEVSEKLLVSFQYMTMEEILEACKEKGLVYIGKGKVISKEDLDTVRSYVDAVRYGDAID